VVIFGALLDLFTCTVISRLILLKVSKNDVLVTILSWMSFVVV